MLIRFGLRAAFVVSRDSDFDCFGAIDLLYSKSLISMRLCQAGKQSILYALENAVMLNDL